MGIFSPPVRDASGQERLRFCPNNKAQRMSQPNQAHIRNQLLTALPPEAFALVQPHLESVTLGLRDPLNAPNQPTPFVYFLDEGLGSVMLGPDRTTGVEVGMVGREGFVGTSVVLGAGQSPHHAFIQVPGTGWRIASDRLTEAMERSSPVRRLLLRYVHVYMVQVASTAHANADYTVEERLARWLLMCHDRSDGDTIAITHEFLALMLGVRRPGVTVATHVLEGEHMIRATRGLITILDREGLRRKANGSYGLAEAEYERLIGGLQRRPAQTVIQFPAGGPAKGASA
jgi:CRP-like cAMP-binding protein